jgi:hypothetical protein
MNLGVPNETRESGHEGKPNRARVDQAELKRWLTTEVDLTVPRWTFVAAGVVAFVLLLLALD